MSYHSTGSGAAVLPLGDDRWAPGTVFPYGEFSVATKDLQWELNLALSKLGCQKIAADGKLGPETCGALNHVLLNPQVVSGNITAGAREVSANCKSSSYSCISSGANVEPQSESTPLPVVMKAKMTLGEKLAAGAVVAALGVGGYLYAKKKGLIG